MRRMHLIAKDQGDLLIGFNESPRFNLNPYIMIYEVLQGDSMAQCAAQT